MIIPGIMASGRKIVAPAAPPPSPAGVPVGTTDITGEYWWESAGTPDLIYTGPYSSTGESGWLVTGNLSSLISSARLRFDFSHGLVFTTPKLFVEVENFYASECVNNDVRIYQDSTRLYRSSDTGPQPVGRILIEVQLPNTIGPENTGVPSIELGMRNDQCHSGNYDKRRRITYIGIFPQ